MNDCNNLHPKITLGEVGWRWHQCQWQDTVAPLVLAPEEACIFLASTDEAQPLFDDHDRLAAANDGRRHDVLNGPTTRQRILATALRKHVLAALCETSPDNILFSRSPAGKVCLFAPTLNPPIFFSQSHVAGYVMLMTSHIPCGVDVESVRCPDDYPAVCRSGLPETWRTALGALNAGDVQRDILFTRYWTALESLYKVVGGSSMRGFIKRVNSRGLQDTQGYCGVHFAVDRRHIACITVKRCPVRLSTFRLKPLTAFLSPGDLR